MRKLGALVLILAGMAALDLASVDPARIKLAALLPLVGLALLADGARGAPLPPTALDGAVLLHVLVALATSAAAPFPGRADAALAVEALAAGTYLLARRRLGPADLAGALGIAGGLLALATLGELVVSPGWKTANAGGVFPAGELVGPLANPNLTASALVLALPASLLVTGGLGLVVVLPALLGTLGRAALAAAGLQVAALVARGDAPGSRRRLVAVAGAAGLLLAIGHAAGQLDLGQVTRGRTLTARRDLWGLLAEEAATRPLGGFGPGRVGIAYGLATARRGRPDTLDDRVDHAHQPLLDAFVRGGFPGLVASLVLAGLALGAVLRGLRSGGPAGALALGLAGFVLAEQTGVGLGTPALACVGALVLGALAAGDARDPPPGIAVLPILVGAGLLLATPGALARARADRARATLQRARPGSLTPNALAALRAGHRATPDARHDSAARLILEGDLGAGVARLLLLEALHPGQARARENRALLRRMQGRAPPAMGPAPP